MTTLRRIAVSYDVKTKESKSVRSADAELLLQVGINLSKSPGDADDSPVFLTSKLGYFSKLTSRRLTSNAFGMRIGTENICTNY